MPIRFPDPGSNSAEASNSEVRYVLAGQPTGWAAMAKEIREFDEEKVRSCKEDIDTLLVFAGLFSAVLSAFLVAAYPSLQIDRMDNVLYTLQVIASQTAGYTITGNALTSSGSPPPPLPPFKPAQNDIRVNILWFASLIISLITASFGMLVKQWLREFLAVDVPSPQARLRIRNFRQPQLETWMIYEIAASLPLLLQLSLGLFLAGLCYFTAAIHNSIGYTTLPLVVGWALFFFAATVLPTFFPRCPYRTTLLKTAVTRLHQAVRSLADWAWDKYRLILDDTFSGPRLPPLRTSNLSILGSCLLRTLLGGIIPAFRSLPDERRIVKAQDQDIGILISVDAVLANDELVVSAISEALHYGHFHWTYVVDFVMQILVHRLPTVPDHERLLPEWPFSSSFPFSNLRPQIIKGIIKVFSENIQEIDTVCDVSALSSSSQGTSQHAERTRLLCLFTIVIAAADVSDEFITSNIGIRSILQWLLDGRNGHPQLWKDWLELAIYQHNTMLEESSGDILQKRYIIAHKLVRVFDALLGDRPNVFASGGVHFFETLMEIRVYSWWGDFNWANFTDEQYNLISDSENHLHNLLHKQLLGLARPSSTKAGGSLVETTFLLKSVLGFTVNVLRPVQVGLADSRHRQENMRNAILDRLSLTIRIALLSEKTTRCLMHTLLDDVGVREPISIQLAQSQAKEMEMSPLQSRHRLNRQVTLGARDVANMKAIISQESRSPDILFILRLCQATMVVFRIVKISSSHRPPIREIFMSLGVTLRSHMSAIPASRRSPAVVAEVAHICLLTIAMYQHPRRLNPESEEQHSESLSIFPDTLVETLMELDVSESQASLSSFFRVRRIKEKRVGQVLQQAKSLASPSDIFVASATRETVTSRHTTDAEERMNASSSAARHSRSDTPGSTIPLMVGEGNHPSPNDTWPIKWHLDLGI